MPGSLPAAAGIRLRLFYNDSFAESLGRPDHRLHPRMVLVTSFGLWVLWNWDTLILHTIPPAHVYDFDRVITSLCTPHPCTTLAIANKLMKENQKCPNFTCTKTRKAPALSACPYAAHAQGTCLHQHTSADRKPWGNAFEVKRDCEINFWYGVDADLAALAAACGSHPDPPREVYSVLVAIYARHH